jgi:hypothetical protein
VTFQVEFTDGMFFDEGCHYRLARIEAGSLNERFRVCIDLWDEDRYRAAWREAAEDVARREIVSCIVTSPTDSPVRHASYTAIYPMRLRETGVAIQNWLVTAPPLKDWLRGFHAWSSGPVEGERMYPMFLRKQPFQPRDLVHPKRSWSGTASEWTTSRDAVVAFAEAH